MISADSTRDTSRLISQASACGSELTVQDGDTIANTTCDEYTYNGAHVSTGTAQRINRHRRVGVLRTATAYDTVDLMLGPLQEDSQYEAEM